ncbi:MAG: 50S ribosomal protein L11 methyltransferase [Longimicrobiales bacterium]
MTPEPGDWFVLTVRVPDVPHAPLVAQGLIDLGGQSVEEAEGEYRSFFPPPEDPDAFAAECLATLQDFVGLAPLEITWRWQPHEDWEELWKRGLGPRRITERLLVTPSWCAPQAEPGDLMIVIDPGTGFGTAEHGTTRGCLRLLDGAVRRGARVLDAGCGSGILSIAAAMLGASEVLAIDDDPQACAPALENVERNGVASSVEVRQECVTGDLLGALGPFDGIVANIRSGVLLPLLEVLGSSLAAGGWLILSGILEEEWPDFVDAAARADLLCSAVDADGEWRSGCFQRLGGTSL